MKKLILLNLIFVCSFLKAQQWDWAVSADLVYGDQVTKKFCRNNTDLFVLLYQYGSSVINNTQLDTGNVIIKINSSGIIQWAKNYPGTINSIYAADNGHIFIIGTFNNTFNFMGTTLVAQGSKDVFYGELDAAGNKLWIKSAGSVNDDAGNDIITDDNGNLFITGSLKDNFYTGAQYHSSHSDIFTFLIRCDQNGNHISDYGDSASNINTGLTFLKDSDGSITLSTIHNYYPCPYACHSNYIMKIDPISYVVSVPVELSTYEYLHSWVVNSDNTISCLYNTGSHYLTSYTLFDIDSNNTSHHRKDLGDGYDGMWTPYMAKSLGNNLIVGGAFHNSFRYGHHDTLRYDSFFVVPDSLPNVIIGEVNTANQFNWILRSDGRGASSTGLLSDELGHYFVSGTYNLHDYFIVDSINPITFGNITLESENKFTRFFVAGASGSDYAGIKVQEKTNRVKIYPNPASNELFIKVAGPKIQSLKIYSVRGELVYDGKNITESIHSINISGIKSGMYIIELLNGNDFYRENFVIAR